MQPLRHSIALAALAFCAGAQAQISDDVVKIGILTGVEVEGTERLLQRLGWQRAGLVMEA